MRQLTLRPRFRCAGRRRNQPKGLTSQTAVFLRNKRSCLRTAGLAPVQECVCLRVWCACVCVHVYTCIRACVECVCIRVYTCVLCVSVYVHMYVWGRVHVSVCLRACVHVCVCRHVYVGCMYMCVVCVCVSVCVHVYMCIVHVCVSVYVCTRDCVACMCVHICIHACVGYVCVP